VKSKLLFNADVSPQHVQQVLPALLDKCTSMALMTMSRIREEHRIKNNTSRTALQRKLRLPIFNNMSDYKCKCGATLDPYGDHCLGYKANHKTKSSNGIRDEVIKFSNASYHLWAWLIWVHKLNAKHTTLPHRFQGYSALWPINLTWPFPWCRSLENTVQSYWVWCHHHPLDQIFILNHLWSC
jgi:hypothetical protein